MALCRSLHSQVSNAPPWHASSLQGLLAPLPPLPSECRPYRRCAGAPLSNAARVSLPLQPALPLQNQESLELVAELRQDNRQLSASLQEARVRSGAGQEQVVCVIDTVARGRVCGA